MTAVATLHVLIVEDEPIFAATVRRYLEWKGHSVAVARDAGEALRQHRAHPADVALIDLALPGTAAGLSPLPQAPLSLDEVERRHIGTVLQKAGWHQGRAARLLGISAKTLYRKIREYGFQRPRHGPDA